MIEHVGSARRMRRLACAGAALCAVMLVPWISAGAHAAAPEPDFVLVETETPPHGRFEGPCGVAVASGETNHFYVSDYYHDTVKVFGAAPGFITRTSSIDPLSGPCALAVAADGSIYVNSYHRHVEKFTPSSFPTIPSTTFASAGIFDSSYPTGVAVDEVTGHVYVNARTYVAVYDSSGAPVLDEGEPLRIGEGSLGDGYGVAVSGFAGTQGRLYVPDAADRTVKVYDPAIDTEDPVATITGGGTPGGGFVSLRDSAVAVDRASGEIYVLDNLQPEHSERPEGVVYVFWPDNALRGRLKFNVIHGRPSGLAVDNSTRASQGRVYVTSGNTDLGSVYAYPPKSATSESVPAVTSVSVQRSGSGSGSVLSRPTGLQCAAECKGDFVAGATVSLQGSPDGNSRFAGWSGGGCSGTSDCVIEAGEGSSVTAKFTALPTASSPSPSRPKPAGGAGTPVAGISEIAQRGKLRVTATGKISPRSLPRRRLAPIAVSVGGKISTTDGSPPPQLRTFRIELNRHGRLNITGLPTCPYNRIQPASSRRALSACRPALVGQGRFTADISLSGQEPYPTKGRLFVFNGHRKGKPVLLGHIFSRRPFATSFVIVFKVQERRRGRYGTVLTASLPRALGNWGNLTGIEMTLSRRFNHRGVRRSYLSAGCPAPNGFPGAIFPFARASFTFAGAKRLAVSMTERCTVRR